MADIQDDEAGKNHSPLNRKRRQFLKQVGFIGAGVALADLILQQEESVGATQLNASPTSETMQLEAETSTIAATTSSGEIPRRHSDARVSKSQQLGWVALTSVRHLAWKKPSVSPMKRLMLG
jgi:hypothetical protein